MFEREGGRKEEEEATDQGHEESVAGKLVDTAALTDTDPT